MPATPAHRSAARAVAGATLAALLSHPRHAILAAGVTGLLLGPGAPGAADWYAAALLAIAALAAASSGQRTLALCRLNRRRKHSTVAPSAAASPYPAGVPAGAASARAAQPASPRLLPGAAAPPPAGSSPDVALPPAASLAAGSPPRAGAPRAVRFRGAEPAGRGETAAELRRSSAGADSARAAAVLALAAVAVLLGAWGAQARLRALDRTRLGPWVGHAVDVRGYVLQPPRARSFGRTVVPVAITAGPGRGERVLAQLHGPISASVGEEVRAAGGLMALPPFEAAARRAGAHALLRASAVTTTGRRRGGVLGAVDSVRRRAERALAAGLPASLAGLARGMVLGEDDELTPAMTADFRASGLAHLVAASGANVALLAALVLALGGLLGIPRTPRLLGAMVLIAAYVPLAGGGASIQRAGVMGAAVLVAALASQPASRWYVLLLAAAVTLGLNPRAAEDPGWQLSFTAVIALLVLVPPLRAGLAGRLPRPLAEALAVCLAATAATAPLIALHFGRVSWVSVPANLLVLPAVAPVMWLGVAASSVGQFAVGLAAPITTLAAWPLAFVAWVGHTGAGLPGANAEWTPPLAAAIAWWIALAALAVPAIPRALRRLAERMGGTRRTLGRQRSDARGAGGRVPGRGVALLAAMVALAAALLAPLGRGAPAAPARLTISALDVGQGDATLIQHGGHAVLVDTGPPGGPVVERLRAAGVTKLDLLVVTHAQVDHDGEAARVLGALPVDAVLDGRDGHPTAVGDRFAAVARARGVRLVTPAAGQHIRAGPIELDVLSPRPEPFALHAGDDPNQRAIVAEVHDGAFSMLLTADAESDVLDGLALSPVDVLKVSHHGSADAGLPALLQRLRPRAAIIEVGEHNSYGHPAPATLAALRAAGVTVYRTDEDGTVRLQP